MGLHFFRTWILRCLPDRLVRSVKQRVRPRRIHVYCVGAGKTGTHSIANLFDKHFRSAHEPELLAMRELLKKEALGLIGHEEKANYLLARDTRLFLEVESAAFNRRNIGILTELFPDARFIVTVRDPYSYTDSVINHLLNHPAALEGERRGFVGIVMGEDRFSHAPEEEELRELGLHTLDGYLSNYAETTAQVLRAIPSERLLVVRTDRIRESVGEIADFLGILKELLEPDRSHAFKAKRKFGVLARMNPDFVDAKVKQHCLEIVREFFPEVQSISDVLPRLQPHP